MSCTLEKKLRNPCWQVYYYASSSSSSSFCVSFVLCSWHPGEKHITSYLLYTIDLLGLGKSEGRVVTRDKPPFQAKGG